jgi:hypothetical protein
LFIKDGVTVREIVKGVITFDGPESALKAVELIAEININVDHRLHPELL